MRQNEEVKKQFPRARRKPPFLSQGAGGETRRAGDMTAVAETWPIIDLAIKVRPSRNRGGIFIPAHGLRKPLAQLCIKMTRMEWV
jgi:hypothetical protein